jgi:hypothetical protein
MIHIVASLYDDYRGIIYDCYIFIIQDTSLNLLVHLDELNHVVMLAYKFHLTPFSLKDTERHVIKLFNNINYDLKNKLDRLKVKTDQLFSNCIR